MSRGYYASRGKIHFVQTLEDSRALCGFSCETLSNVTTNREDVTCSRCKRMLAGKKVVEDSEEWGGFSMSCPGRRTHKW